MKFTRRTKVVAQRPDVIPVVNVVLLLLLFFVIALRFVQEPGVSIRLPETSATSSARTSPYPPLIITVTAESAESRFVAIFFNDELVDLRRLGVMLGESARQNPFRDVVIKADKRAAHGLVVSILGLAQQAGFRNVRLATQIPESTSSPPR